VERIKIRELLSGTASVSPGGFAGGVEAHPETSSPSMSNDKGVKTTNDLRFEVIIEFLRQIFGN
jgi:hypothetical protein